jgi:hypothetical protein
MKKAGIISVLLIFIFQSVGVFLLFRLKQSDIRQEIKSRIKAGVPEAELTIFRFDSEKLKQLKWVDGHEFIYQERMYDIVSTTYDGEIVVYHCLHDIQETRLFKDLNNLVANKMSKDKNSREGNHAQVVNWFCQEEIQLFSMTPVLLGSISSQYSFNLKSNFQIPESPPPVC